MTTPLDLWPTARAVAGLLDGIADDRLDARTPCAGTSVGALLDHLMGLTLAFTLAARKTTDDGRLATESPPGGASADHLDPDWRRLLPQRLDELAEAWLDPAAWQGKTEAGGLEMPGEVTGAVAATELVIHGWDVARATGQPYEVDPAAVEASLVFTSATAEETDGAGQEGLFGPVVEVPASAPPLDRSLGLSGRDPAWKACRIVRRDQVMSWVAGYERAWRADDLDGVARLFSAEARYRVSPYDESEVGVAAIQALWLDDEGRDFEMTATPVAVDGLDAVVRVQVSYRDPTPQEYLDLWVLRFDRDGRVEDFEEWAYWPGAPYADMMWR